MVDGFGTGSFGIEEPFGSVDQLVVNPIFNPLTPRIYLDMVPQISSATEPVPEISIADEE